MRRVVEGSNDVVPSWSREGRWIYFASTKSGNWQVWKVPAEGGHAVQVTKQGGFAAFESPDGKFVYFTKTVPGLWRVPVQGGDEIPILKDLTGAGYWGYWAVVKDGIYFINTEATPRPTILYYGPDDQDRRRRENAC